MDGGSPSSDRRTRLSLEHSFQEQELLSDDDRARLRGVQIELDQSWDLLRQRRALRAAGQDPK